MVLGEFNRTDPAGSNDQPFLAVCRVAGAMGICFPYLGEFQPTKYREKILCWMEMFWTVGIIILPGKVLCTIIEIISIE